MRVPVPKPWEGKEAVGHGVEGAEEYRGNREARKIIYKEVWQTVLLYKSNIFVKTNTMVKLLEAFHYGIGRIITGNTE